MPRRTINLALQGGGALGAFTWGVLERLLEEQDLRFEAISGSSAGAATDHPIGLALTTTALGTLLPILREWKQAGRIRYYGVTTTFEGQYPVLLDLMRREKLDFVQVEKS